MKLYFFFVGTASCRDGIVAGSHSHMGNTSLPIGRRAAPQPVFYGHIKVLLQNVVVRFAKCTIPGSLGLSGHAAGSKLPVHKHGLSVTCGSCMISD
jgi:hypothetical protein